MALPEHFYSYKNVTGSAGQVVIKPNGGFLHAVVVNSPSTIGATLYDNTTGSGTKIATLPGFSSQGSIVYDITFANGLTVVTTGTSGDLTVVYI